MHNTVPRMSQGHPKPRKILTDNYFLGNGQSRDSHNVAHSPKLQNHSLSNVPSSRKVYSNRSSPKGGQTKGSPNLLSKFDSKNRSLDINSYHNLLKCSSKTPKNISLDLFGGPIGQPPQTKIAPDKSCFHKRTHSSVKPEIYDHLRSPPRGQSPCFIGRRFTEPGHSKSKCASKKHNQK